MTKEITDQQYNMLTLSLGYLTGWMMTSVPPARQDEFRDFAIKPLCDILGRDPYDPFQPKKEQEKQQINNEYVSLHDLIFRDKK